MDSVKNFAYSLVATAPSPATSGTSLVVTAGQGSYFPATPFDATIWPAGAQPLNTNAEIVRVTNVATDTFTITRAQYGTTAQSITAGYQIAQTVDANLLNQLAPLSGATFTGEVVAPDFKASGLTGATTATRYVGGTTNTAPTSGTFAVGDFVVDQSGTIWVCTTAGTPGTWTTTISSHLSLRTASATVSRNETTIFSGSTASQTLTAPSSPIDGSTWTVINKASVAVTLSFTPSMIPLSSGTGVTTFSIPASGSCSFVNYNGSQWYMVATNSADQLINVLPTANGGTGLSTIGTAGQVLTVNSGATGLQYSTPSSGSPTVSYATSGTAAAGETSITTAASVIITLPSAPADGTTNTIVTNSTSASTVARGGTDTFTYYNGTTNSFTTGATANQTVLPLSTVRFTYRAGVWYIEDGVRPNALSQTISVVQGGTGATTAALARVGLGIVIPIIQPAAHGVKAWTFDPVTCMTELAQTPTKGVAYATRIHMNAQATVSTIGFISATVGAGIANSYVSLYSAAGAVLGYGALPSLVANTYQTVTLTAVGSLNLTADTDYFIVIQIGTSTTTAPSFYASGDGGGSGAPLFNAALMNFNTTPAANTLTGRCSSWGTTLNTIPAAVTGFTPAFTLNNFFATLN